jgi:uncharacterized membrane protein YqjE
MVFVGVIIGVIILAAIVYMAVDKKSTLTIRLASIGAIAVMFIALIICLIIIFSDKTVPVDPSLLIVGAPAEVQEKKSNPFAIVLSIIFIVTLFVFIVIVAMKEYKKNKPKTDDDNTSGIKPISNW